MYILVTYSLFCVSPCNLPVLDLTAALFQQEGTLGGRSGRAHAISSAKAAAARPATTSRSVAEGLACIAAPLLGRAAGGGCTTPPARLYTRCSGSRLPRRHPASVDGAGVGAVMVAGAGAGAGAVMGAGVGGGVDAGMGSPT